MTNFDPEESTRYVRELLEFVLSQSSLTIGRVHNRTVNEHWGRSEVMTVRSHHLTLVASGVATFHINGETVILRRGTMLFTSPKCEQTYGYDPGEPPTVLTVRFDPQAHHADMVLPQPPPHGCYFAVTPNKNTAFLELMEQLFRCWIRRTDPIADRAACWTLQSLLWALYEESFQTHSGSWDLLMEDVQMMLDSDPEGERSIADLARQVGLSAGHFSRRFHRHAGITAKSYQFQSRMRHARDLLHEEGLSVKEVAARLGYSDPFVFSRQFKKIWGVPPSKL
jgi:AraC-like DNA-binding protein